MKMSARVTLKDVAREAGVSYQTVSKVLNGQVQVTPETRERIETAVAQLGYRPNTTARSLRTQSTQLIGYSWKPNPNKEVNPILEEFLNSIVAAAEACQHHVMLFPFTGDDDQWVNTYRELISTNRVDGFILSGLDYDDPRIPLLQEMDFPFVAFGRSNPEHHFPFVDVDGRAGIRSATDHLIQQGHQQVAVIAWPEGSRVGSARLNGYLEAMEKANLPISPDWIQRWEGSYQNGYQAAATLLDLPENQRPTAVVTLVDIMAIGVMRAVQDRGLRVGPDVAITGFDNTPLVQYLNPGLTSLRQPVTQIGQKTVGLLTALLKGDRPERSEILLKPELIIRQSSLR